MWLVDCASPRKRRLQIVFALDLGMEAPMMQFTGTSFFVPGHFLQILRRFRFCQLLLCDGKVCMQQTKGAAYCSRALMSSSENTHRGFTI